MAACRKWNRNLRNVGDSRTDRVMGHLMPKRHVQNDRKRSLLSDQSVVLPPKEGSERFGNYRDNA